MRPVGRFVKKESSFRELTHRCCSIRNEHKWVQSHTIESCNAFHLPNTFYFSNKSLLWLINCCHLAPHEVCLWIHDKGSFAQDLLGRALLTYTERYEMWPTDFTIDLQLLHSHILSLSFSVSRLLLFSLCCTYTVQIIRLYITFFTVFMPCKSIRWNWSFDDCGGTSLYGCQHCHIRTQAQHTDTTSGSATTLRGSLMPGMYLLFSWSSLIISVSLRPPTISSNTHMRTCKL